MSVLYSIWCLGFVLTPKMVMVESKQLRTNKVQKEREPNKTMQVNQYKNE